jgi:hypothetical protein
MGTTLKGGRHPSQAIVHHGLDALLFDPAALNLAVRLTPQQKLTAVGLLDQHKVESVKRRHAKVSNVEPCVRIPNDWLALCTCHRCCMHKLEYLFGTLPVQSLVIAHPWVVDEFTKPVAATLQVSGVRWIPDLSPLDPEQEPPKDPPVIGSIAYLAFDREALLFTEDHIASQATKTLDRVVGQVPGSVPDSADAAEVSRAIISKRKPINLAIGVLPEPRSRPRRIIWHCVLEH